MRCYRISVAVRTTTIEPVEGFSTGRALAVGFLFFNPGIDTATHYFPEILDDSLMMLYPIDDMDVSKLFQPFTGKVGTLETPGDLVGGCTFTKPMATIDAMM